MLVSGPALSNTGLHGDNNMLPWEAHATEAGVADGLDAVRKKVRENIKYGVDLIKICATGGVKVAFGTDAAVYPHGLMAHELAVYVRLGMTPLQAVRTATLTAADLLGWSDRVGTIQPGKCADFVAVPGDPLKDITELERVKFVMRGGKVYKNL
jgi:imidazolonepropionase-like amidohydrolase